MRRISASASSRVQRPENSMITPYSPSSPMPTPIAAASRSGVRSTSAVQSQMAKSLSRPFGKIEETFARTTAAFGRPISRTPLVNAIVGGVGGAGGSGAGSSDRRMRNGVSSGHLPSNGWMWSMTSAPVTS